MLRDYIKNDIWFTFQYGSNQIIVPMIYDEAIKVFTFQYGYNQIH